MDVAGKVVVVTGAANGIGKALAERFHAEGAAAVAVSDLDGAGAERVARSIGGRAFATDVGKEADIVNLIETVERELGPIDLFCSNAGVHTCDPGGGAASAPNEVWLRDFGINVMAHVYAARALVPLMRTRGGGYLLNVVSATGLLTRIGSAVYSTTKHAAVGFSESLAITHRDDGIRVSMLCPQAVDTVLYRLVGETNETGPTGEADGILTPEDVAQCVVEGIADERFLILSHPATEQHMRTKVADYQRWIAGMAKFRRKLIAARPTG